MPVREKWWKVETVSSFLRADDQDQMTKRGLNLKIRVRYKEAIEVLGRLGRHRGGLDECEAHAPSDNRRSASLDGA